MGDASAVLRRKWPVLRRYEGEDRRAISLPLGGIGTGTIGLGGHGQLRDWELQNHPSKGSSCAGTFFAIRVAEAGRRPVARIVKGALFAEEYRARWVRRWHRPDYRAFPNAGWSPRTRSRG